nr:immunoglobulin light chain junction region [Macaca mulatta]MOV81618.1 immunoglobulin light chain junction region [Macaca mulatta]
CQQDYNWPPTF